jgi:hypothetical protein
VGPLEEDLDLSLGHLLPDLPMHDRATITVQDGIQGVECPEIRLIPRPVFVGSLWLLKTGPLARCFPLLGLKQPPAFSTRYTLRALTATPSASNLIYAPLR